MNGKDLLSGMNHIDDKFVDEAERKPLHIFKWIDWVALVPLTAAFFLVVIFGAGGLFLLMPTLFAAGGAAETPYDAVSSVYSIIYGFNGSAIGESWASEEFEVQYFQTDGEAPALAQTAVFGAQKEFEEFYEANQGRYALDEEFLKACEKYDDAYFREHILVILISKDRDDLISTRIHGVYAGELTYTGCDWVIAVWNEVLETQRIGGTVHLTLLELDKSDGFQASDSFEIWYYDESVAD